MDKQYSPYSLNVENLQLLRSQRKILSNISFEAKAGEALLLRGANGVGKTSLLMALAGYLYVEIGLIAWSCKKIKDDERSAFEEMHFISYQHAIKENLTLVENLRFWANLYGGNKLNISLDIDLALEKVGLAHAANFDALMLSAGQKKRLSLARLLVSPRPIWLLDEPTAALDSLGDKLVANMIDDHLDAGGLVIAATHLDLVMKKNKRVKTLILRQDSLEQADLDGADLSQTSLEVKE